MKLISKWVFFVLVYSAVSLAVGDEPAEEVLTYRGASDASAAVGISDDMFIVADDENNILRVYKTSDARGGASRPVFSYDVTGFLGIELEHPEADIEGATMIAEGPRFAGNHRIYWITSHGRNKDGKMRPNRYRFFATTVEVKNGKVTIRPVGQPYKTLVHELVKNERMRNLGLDKATRFDEDLSKSRRKKLAPKEQGLNIEGLCASADGKTLYIGFRNPRPYDKMSRRAKALVVPLKNPEQVIERKEEPIFDEPILWDLAGLGIRSMEYSNFHKAYFIVAGPYDGGPKFALYRWSGEKETPPKLLRQLHTEKKNFNPEALVTFKDSAKILLLSDDGTLVIEVSGAWECMEGEFRKDGTCLNKFLINPNKKTFRGIWLQP